MKAELAYAAYEGLQGYCVSRGEYDSLLNKHSALARAHREAQQTIDNAKRIFETADAETDFDDVLHGMYEALGGNKEGSDKS